MNLLDEDRTSTAKGTVSAVSGGDEMIAEESISCGQTGSGHRGLAICVQGNVRGESRRDGCQIMIGEVLECDAAGGYRSGRAGVGDCSRERERLTHDYRANSGMLEARAIHTIPAAEGKELPPLRV